MGTPAQVFEEPASPFVMRFLGAVNVFRGRVDGGRAYVGDLEFSAPEAGARAAAHVYVRPHELEIDRAAVPGSFAARVERVVTLGAAVRVELSRAARTASGWRPSSTCAAARRWRWRRAIGSTSPRAGCGSSPGVSSSRTPSPRATCSGSGSHPLKQTNGRLTGRCPLSRMKIYDNGHGSRRPRPRKDTAMERLRHSLLYALAIVGGLLTGLAASPPAAEPPREVTLLNVSYDPTRELYEDFNAGFAADWKARTGQTGHRASRATAAPASRPAR